MLYPLKFSPIFKPRIWGGRRLAELFAKPLPALPSGVPIGESWELSGLPGDESVVANGPLAGAKLTDLLARFGADLLGSATLIDGRFPLLVKLLDARQPLSVQVHPARGSVIPSDPAASPKNECWYVVDADPGARIWVGLTRGVDRARFAAAIRDGTVAALLRDRPIRAGDFVYLPAGTVHALGGGAVIAEVQDPSDTTYRVFDWGRVDAATGRPRTLHVEQALAAIDFRQSTSPPAPPATRGPRVTRLLGCEHFIVDRLDLPAGQPRPIADLADRQMLVLMFLSGEGTIELEDVAHPPRVCPISPASCGRVTAEGGCATSREGTPEGRAAGCATVSSTAFAAGDLILLPAAMPPASIRPAGGAACQCLAITVPPGRSQTKE